MRRDCTPIWIDSQAESEQLQRIPFTKKEFDEDFLQQTLDRCPELLPVDEFAAGYGPLVSLGREIDHIDNLFVDPAGRLTIVEAKLWRNPEATRKVVAQILEYATRVATWSYDELEQRCRAAGGTSSPLAERSLYELVRDHFPAEVPSEEKFVDSVERSLRTGRFLLLIVGDGIRECLPRILEALHTHPRFLFTFGLVELQVYSDPTNAQRRLVIPQILANSQEVVRGIVKVETAGEAKVTVELDDSKDEEGRPSKRRKLSEEEFFDELSNGLVTDTARTLVDAVRELGALVQPGGSSLSIRLKDPRGSNRKLTLFVLTTGGELYTGWLYRQLEEVGLSDEIAYRWVASIAKLIPGVAPKPKFPSELSRYVKLIELAPRVDDFLDRLRDTIEAIRGEEV